MPSDIILVSYKHPRKRKLRYVTFLTMEDANKAPKELSCGGYLQYGMHIVDWNWRYL